MPKYKTMAELKPKSYFRIHGKLYRKPDIMKSKGMYCIGSERGPHHGIAFDFATASTVEFPGDCPVEETTVHIVDEAEAEKEPETVVGPAETNPDWDSDVPQE